jgi:APA family basic amino acid/polyamine antiporter
VARKLPRLQRVLDAPALFSVAYGEIASSIYFALGIIALHALGLTPAVLLAAGGVFLLVSLSYAEGTAAIRETGGAATFVRRAVNDLAGFLTGWVLFLDYLIVIALSALSVPHYAGAAFGLDGLRDNPWDVVTGVGVIAAIATARLLRRARLYRFALVVALVDLLTQSLLVVLGFSLLFSPHALSAGTDLGVSPSWGGLAFALPLAFLAYTGLETVANLAEETRSPGRDLPRSLFSAIGVVVVLYVAIALVGLSAFPPENGQTELAGEWLRAPLMGIVDQLDGPLPGPLAGALQVYVGLTAVLIMVAAATTSISGFGRLAYSLGEHGMLPTSFGRLHRRTLVSPQSIVLAALIAAALLVGASVVRPDDEVQSLASLFSFGILLAFTAAQFAVIALRFQEPELRRPFRVPLGVRVWGFEVPVPAVVGLVLTFVIWIVALATHPGSPSGWSSTSRSADRWGSHCWRRSCRATSGCWRTRATGASSCP